VPEIKIELSAKSIGDAVREVRRYQKWVAKKETELRSRLAMLGATVASIQFARAIYAGSNDVTVRVDNTGSVAVIYAEGEAVAFIEFGAGVYHNPGEPCPDPRPAGIVGIGEYGKGYGKRQTWVFRDEAGEKVFTHGNPAAMPMWYASEEMRSKITQIAREVFG
jgi:hypothetical protein